MSTATAEECVSILNIVFCNCYTCLRDNCTGHANDTWNFTSEHSRRAMLSAAGGHERQSSRGRCRANEKVNKVCGGMFTSGHPSQTEDNK